jgi:WYL domain
MGNTSNRDQWASRERLRFIERTAWWRGIVNRGDLREVFGISAAQASADIQAYLGMNPGALAYNLTTKRYESAPEMRCLLHTPSLEEAVQILLGGGATFPSTKPVDRAGKVDCFVPPTRRPAESVERRVFFAINGGRRLKIRYWSVASARATQREIAPHALGHDGYRWHARAWCFENSAFRDFVLSRIERAEWPTEAFTPPVSDLDWESYEDLVLVPNPDLDEIKQQAIKLDFGMRDGKLRLQVRRAMRHYTLQHLRISPESDTDAMPWMVEQVSG